SNSELSSRRILNVRIAAPLCGGKGSRCDRKSRRARRGCSLTNFPARSREGPLCFERACQNLARTTTLLQRWSLRARLAEWHLGSPEASRDSTEECAVRVGLRTAQVGCFSCSAGNLNSISRW